MDFSKWLRDKFVSERLGESQLVDIAKGKRLEQLAQSGVLDILCEEILDPMDLEAFELFKSLDPSDFNAVNQAQKISAVIADIKKRIKAKIDQGLRAQAVLREIAEE